MHALAFDPPFSLESKPFAKTIDLCNNPMTKVALTSQRMRQVT